MSSAGTPQAAPIPLTIIGGYLGAGKTTLVNHVLRHANGLRLAVLVNEFGSLPIDADLIEARDGNLVSISGGCVCCSYGDDLVSGLMDIVALSPRPDHILLEASGVALPEGIAATASLLRDIALDGIIVLADMETIVAHARDRYMGDTVTAQLAAADLLVLNKADLASGEMAPARTALLQQHAPTSRVLTVEHGQIPLEILLAADIQQRRKVKPARHHHAPATFESRTMVPAGPVDADGLAKRLADAQLALLRAKGFVRSSDGDTYAIQIVGRRWSVSTARTVADPGLILIALPGGFEGPAFRDLLRDFDGSSPTGSGGAPV